MRQVEKSFVSLSDKTTLEIGGLAQNYVEISSIDELPQLVEKCKKSDENLFILGEGSNVCFSNSTYYGCILKLTNRGIDVVGETERSVELKVAAGENWDSFVKYTVSKGWWGIENMSLIPGSVGACPVQNVGAYGQDCSQVIKSVSAYDIEKKKFVSFSNQECRFGFRKSIFNEVRENKFIITDVTFELSKHAAPNLSRKSVRLAIDVNSNELQSDIRKAIISERTNGINLPDAHYYGSAGTFFKTAIVDKEDVPKILFRTLLNLGPKVTLLILGFIWKYRSKNGCKLPSKFLIQSCNLSDYSVNSIGLLKTNPAVVITKVGEKHSSDDLIELIINIRRMVFNKTGVKIPIEPSLVGFSKREIDRTFHL